MDFFGILKVEELEVLKRVLESYKKIKKENKELKSITQSYNAYEQPAGENTAIVIADTRYFVDGYFKESFIEKEKIREKKEKLEKELEELEKKSSLEMRFSDWQIIDNTKNKIQVLKEILGEEGGE